MQYPSPHLGVYQGVWDQPPGVLTATGWEPTLEGAWGTPPRNPTDFDVTQTLACLEAEGSLQSGTQWLLVGTAVRPCPARCTCWSPINQTRGPCLARTSQAQSFWVQSGGFQLLHLHTMCFCPRGCPLEPPCHLAMGPAWPPACSLVATGWVVTLRGEDRPSHLVALNLRLGPLSPFISQMSP